MQHFVRETMNPSPQEFSDELISAYLDGELSPEEKARVEDLLIDSPEHRRLFEELKALRTTLHSLPSYQLGGDFAKRVLQKAEREMLTGSKADEDSAAPQQETEQANTSAAPPVLPTPGTKPNEPSEGSWRGMIWAVAVLAAALAVALALPIGLRETNQSEDVATTAGSEDKRFESMTAAESAGEEAYLEAAGGDAADSDDAEVDTDLAFSAEATLAAPTGEPHQQLEAAATGESRSAPAGGAAGGELARRGEGTNGQEATSAHLMEEAAADELADLDTFAQNDGFSPSAEAAFPADEIEMAPEDEMTEELAMRSGGGGGAGFGGFGAESSESLAAPTDMLVDVRIASADFNRVLQEHHIAYAPTVVGASAGALRAEPDPFSDNASAANSGGQGLAPRIAQAPTESAGPQSFAADDAADAPPVEFPAQEPTLLEEDQADLSAYEGSGEEGSPLDKSEETEEWVVVEASAEVIQQLLVQLDIDASDLKVVDLSVAGIRDQTVAPPAVRETHQQRQAAGAAEAAQEAGAPPPVPGPGLAGESEPATGEQEFQEALAEEGEAIAEPMVDEAIEAAQPSTPQAGRAIRIAPFDANSWPMLPPGQQSMAGRAAAQEAAVPNRDDAPTDEDRAEEDLAEETDADDAAGNEADDTVPEPPAEERLRDGMLKPSLEGLAPETPLRVLFRVESP